MSIVTGQGRAVSGSAQAEFHIRYRRFRGKEPDIRIRNGELRDIEVPDQKVYRFILPHGVPHAIKNTGDRSNVLIAFNTSVHDPENPDTVQDILIDG